MKNPQTLNRNFEEIGWGALLIWWGVTAMAKFLPDGVGAIGIGLILLGMNAARHYTGIAVSSLATTLGILALVWGGLTLAGAVLSLPFELPVFAILLIVMGVLTLGRETLRIKNQG